MKKIFSILAMCTVLSANGQTSVWDGSHTTWTNGNGTQANPYLIENAAQLAHLAYVVNNGLGAGADTYWKLTTDIDLNGNNLKWPPEDFLWIPIGYDYNPFSGNFDGNGKTISNLRIYNTDFRYIGLFGYTDGASIKNLGIVGSSLVATGSFTTLEGVYAGSMAGFANNTVIDNCYYTGGNIFSYELSSYYYYSGGIVGYIGGNSAINNCYNTGGIVFDNSPFYNDYSGGIAGCIGGNSTINNCYNAGGIDSYHYSSYKGGIVGNTPAATAVNNSYYLFTCGAAGAGVAQTEAEMKSTEFINLLNSGVTNAYFYIQDLTPFVNNGYPIRTKIFNINENNEYLIENKEDLISLANLVNNGNSLSGQTFILANNITLPKTPNNILSIGNKNTNRPFSGTFHGNGKRIYNVYIDEPNTEYQGFFGYTKNAYLYEVGLVDITASGRNYTGGMVGYAENTRIDNSYIKGGTLFSLNYCGGMIGYQTSGTNSIITGCYNQGCTVTGNNYVGGLLGYSDRGTVRSSYVSAPVLSQSGSSSIGAIIGGAQDVLRYNVCYNRDIIGQLPDIGENKVSQGAPPREKMQANVASSEGNMSSNDMRISAFVSTLNQGLVTPVWKMDYNPPINNGFPILIWQTNQQTGINDVATGSATIIAYYSILGQKLPKEPESGVYIIMYNNGKTVKIVK